jgi:hypothetical protein
MVGGGEASALGYTNNGRDWLSSDSGNALFRQVLSVAYSGSLWVAAGPNSDTTNSMLASSPDGITWTPGSSGNPAVPLNEFAFENCSIAWNGTKWIAAGIYPGELAPTVAWTSTNGSTWYPLTVELTGMKNATTVAWGGIWIIGGNAAGTGLVPLIYSYDGTNWKRSATGSTVFATQCTQVVWNGQTWLGIGLDATNKPVLASSADGIVWTPVIKNGTSVGPSLFGDFGTINSLVWNGSLWVMGGSGNAPPVIYYSRDGINWTWSDTGSLFNFVGTVSWNGSSWIAGGQGPPNSMRLIAYSSDLINWTKSDSGASVFQTHIFNITGSYLITALPTPPSTAPGTLAGNMSMTGGGLVTWSSDAISWTEDITLVTNPVNSNSLDGTLFKIGPSTVQMGELDSLYYAPPLGSADTYNAGSLHVINAIDRNHEAIADNWFLVANTSLGNSILKWNPATISIPPDATYNSVTAQPSWISGGGGQTVSTFAKLTTSSLNVSTINLDANNIIQVNDHGDIVIQSNNGAALYLMDTIDNTGFVSVNGQLKVGTLLDSFSLPGTPGQFLGITGLDGTISWQTPTGNVVSENFCVACDTTGIISYSYDGIKWFRGNHSDIEGGFTTMAWNGSYWLAQGGGYSHISTDGINWNMRITPSTNFKALAWNGSIWVGVGSPDSSHAGSPAIATSPDGINWTYQDATTNPFGTTGTGNGVAWNGSYWVVVGIAISGSGRSIATSPDGITWTAQTSPFNEQPVYGIAWNGYMWAAVGDGGDSGTGIATSLDGIIWTARGPEVNWPRYTNSIAWNGTLWIAASTDNIGSVVTSSDGQLWTISNPVGQDGPVNSVAWNGSIWIAICPSGGGNSNMSTSPDGLTWTPIDTSSAFGTNNTGRFIASRRTLPFSSNVSADTLYAAALQISTINGVPYTGGGGGTTVSSFDTLATSTLTIPDSLFTLDMNGLNFRQGSIIGGDLADYNSAFLDLGFNSIVELNANGIRDGTNSLYLNGGYTGVYIGVGTTNTISNTVSSILNVDYIKGTGATTAANQISVSTLTDVSTINGVAFPVPALPTGVVYGLQDPIYFPFTQVSDNGSLIGVWYCDITASILNYTMTSFANVQVSIINSDPATALACRIVNVEPNPTTSIGSLRIYLTADPGPLCVNTSKSLNISWHLTNP